MVSVGQNYLVRTPVLATWIIRSKTGPTKPGKISFPTCKQRRVGVPSDVVTRILLLEPRYFQGMEKLLSYGPCFATPSAAEEWLLGCTLLWLYSLDQTALDLLTAGNSCRPWPKQVGTDRRKCPLTATTDHAQAPGEAAGMHQNGSRAPRAFSKAGSNMAAGPLHRATRYSTETGIGSSFAGIGSARPRLLLAGPRSPQKPSP